MIKKILDFFKKSEPIKKADDLPPYNMDNPEWIEYRRKNNKAYDKSRKTGITEFPHTIKCRKHGHGFYIGEKVCLTHECVYDNPVQRCNLCKDDIELVAQNKEGIVFNIKNCEIR